MELGNIRAFFRLGRQNEQIKESPSAYSALATSPMDPIDILTDAVRTSEEYSFDDCRMDRQRSATPSRLSQFLSHFTLGFADGLTVPFALTAGLSSLGQTQTVIYAGAAEICAGCISMGIGGYLAARGETTSETDGDDHNEKVEEAERTEQDGIQRYFALLDLPPDLLRSMSLHVDSRPDIQRKLLCNTNSTTDDAAGDVGKFPPVIVGLSVAIGYILGGLLPLLPYVFVDKVDDGLQWSFVICMLSLFVFGFVKDFLLHSNPVEGSWRHRNVRREAARWERVKHGWWEGIRMVIMGGVAAVAAVLCIRLFEGFVP
ncbi:DUF125-domain-containing protein [Jackrogersella minutella]|nr:DUF125-domain-containing protein [Jackrogersella minutella]